MRVKPFKQKELFLCACVALVLMSLMTILPVHAASGKDWDVEWKYGYKSYLGVEADGYWTTEDEGGGYYKTEHIAVRWVESPVILMPPFIMYYSNIWANSSTYTMLQETELNETFQSSPNSPFARTRGYSQFKNTNTGESWPLQTDWAWVWRLT